MKNNGSYIITFLILLLVCISVIGCTHNITEPQDNELDDKDDNYRLEVIDDSGNSIILDKKPERIISLAPSHTEILYALGLESEIVGVTQFCNYPEEAMEKPKIGDSYNLDIEKIIELEPDLVVQYWEINDEFKNLLDSAGITLVIFNPESISETISTIIDLGLITGTNDKAIELTKHMQERKNDLLERVRNVQKKNVFYEIEYSSDLWTVGKDSFIDELITLSGGLNIAKDAKGSYVQYSVEAMIEKDPEVYITNTFNVNVQKNSDIKDRPGFENLSAIKNGEVKILDGDLLSRPSHRVIDALELMVKAIHPELF